MNTLMKKYITSILGTLVAVALLVPAGFIQAQSNMFSQVGGAGVTGQSDPTTGASWQGGNCSNEQSQLVQLQDAFNQKQNTVLTTKQQTTQIYAQIAQLQSNGVGPYALKVSPTSPTAGKTFTVNATVASTTIRAYTIELIKDGQIITTFTTNEQITQTARPATISRDFLMPANTQPGGYSLRMKDPSNQSVKSVIDFQVL